MLLSLFLACQTQTVTTPGVLPSSGKVLVTVNGQKITEDVVDALLSQVPESKREEIKTGPTFERLKEQLITTEILYREAIKANLHTNDENKVAMALAQREVLANSIVGQLAESRITDEKISQWYDDHQVQFKKEEADLSMLVVDTQEKADAVLKLLDGGADFAKVVAEHSIDPQTKSTGGSMGTVDLRGIPPNMKTELDKAEDGKHTGAIQMGTSFAILKVNSRNDTLTPLAEVRDQIQEQMMQEESQTLVKELRDKATVTTPDAPPAAEIKIDATPKAEEISKPEEKK
jgi:peptidyl-prolyl cis-trans isomerase C